jgi:hypothetical protein
MIPKSFRLFQMARLRGRETKGVWAVSCGIMPSGCPPGDPDNDTEIMADCEPEEYFVNKTLHDMI